MSRSIRTVTPVEFYRDPLIPAHPDILCVQYLNYLLCLTAKGDLVHSLRTSGSHRVSWTTTQGQRTYDHTPEEQAELFADVLMEELL